MVMSRAIGPPIARVRAVQHYNWFKAAGFTRIEPVSVVHVTVDRPFVAENGNSSALTQDLALVNAWV